MRELSLFTGAGGGVYGLKLCGARCVAYVEFNKFCQAVIHQRIADGIFDDAPIFNDVRTFDGTVWRGRADIISAGFPCTPFAICGRRRGADDPKNMWPDTARIIGEVMPRLVFLENSPALAFSGYLGRVLADLSALGFDAEWSTLSAQACGAPHKRDRLWILARLADAHRERLQAACSLTGRSAQKITRSAREDPSQGGWWSVDPATAESSPAHESTLGRVVDGVADRRERIKALGNGQVPVVVAHAFRSLLARFNEEM